MRKKGQKGDVCWFAPKKRKPIAYTSKATSDLICALSTQGISISDVMERINYDHEAKAVLKKYIALGYGDIEAKQWFR